MPAAATTWLLRDAIRVMEQAGTDRLAVCDDGRFVGVITAADLVQLNEVIESTESG